MKGSKWEKISFLLFFNVILFHCNILELTPLLYKSLPIPQFATIGLICFLNANQ